MIDQESFRLPDVLNFSIASGSSVVRSYPCGIAISRTIVTAAYIERDVPLVRVIAFLKCLANKHL